MEDIYSYSKDTISKKKISIPSLCNVFCNNVIVWWSVEFKQKILSQQVLKSENRN